MNKYEKLWNAALYYGTMQIEQEFLDFTKFIDEKIEIQSFLEIGIYNGATFYAWSSLAADNALRMGIDWANSAAFGSTTYRSPIEIAAIKQRLEIYKPNTHIMFGNSQLKHVYDWTVETLGDKKLDFLFIDADHTYEGVKKDFERYSPLVRQGGIIALHDIKDTPYHNRARCKVSQFWNELKGEKYEFTHPSPKIEADFGGFGAIVKD
jgi:hypothetical protein